MTRTMEFFYSKHCILEGKFNETDDGVTLLELTVYSYLDDNNSIEVDVTKSVNELWMKYLKEQFLEYVYEQIDRENDSLAI